MPVARVSTPSASVQNRAVIARTAPAAGASQASHHAVNPRTIIAITACRPTIAPTATPTAHSITTGATTTGRGPHQQQQAGHQSPDARPSITRAATQPSPSTNWLAAVILRNFAAKYSAPNSGYSHHRVPTSGAVTDQLRTFRSISAPSRGSSAPSHGSSSHLRRREQLLRRRKKDQTEL